MSYNKCHSQTANIFSHKSQQMSTNQRSISSLPISEAWLLFPAPWSATLLRFSTSRRRERSSCRRSARSSASAAQFSTPRWSWERSRSGSWSLARRGLEKNNDPICNMTQVHRFSGDGLLKHQRDDLPTSFSPNAYTKQVTNRWFSPSFKTSPRGRTNKRTLLTYMSLTGLQLRRVQDHQLIINSNLDSLLRIQSRPIFWWAPCSRG